MMTGIAPDNNNRKLLMVYNTDNKLFNKLSDYLHKIVKPQTYSCQLCLLTHGNIRIKKKWKNFISRLEIDIDFIHKDEYLKKDQNSFYKFPTILELQNSNVKSFISSTEINECKSLDDLIKIMSTRFSLKKRSL